MPNCYHNKRAFRRDIEKKKTENKFNILRRGYYMVSMSFGFPGNKPIYNETGYIEDDSKATYVKYSGKSNAQRFLKRMSHKKIRNNKEIYPKGNTSNKNFDYYWALY